MTTQKNAAINFSQIRRVAVIGAGVMGAGIAAQAANGGAEVLLLDRNQIAYNALERMKKAGSKGGLMSPEAADRIRVGNTEDDFALLAEQDWIVEAVVERLEIKQALYQRIDQIRAPHCIVSSNTSTLPLNHLLEGMSDGFRQHFVVTHFFNPPRYMQLVEFVSTAETSPESLVQLQHFNDQVLGKTVIHCADQPGFIANRLGVYWMQVALQEALALELNVVQADRIMQLCGFPKTGVFGLWDLCGIDLMPEVTGSLSHLLDENDAFQWYAKTPALIETMVAKGWHGRKGALRQGFYRQLKDDAGHKQHQQLNLNTMEYEFAAELATDWPSLKLKNGMLAELVAQKDKGGEFARRVLARVIHYASLLVPDVAKEIASVDTAMMLGYNWRFGPFQLRDQIGAVLFDRVLNEQIDAQPEAFPCASPWLAVASKPEIRPSYQHKQQLDIKGAYHSVSMAKGIIRWQDVIQQPNEPLINGLLSRLWSVDERVLCFELSARINTLNSRLLDELEAALHFAVNAEKALLIYSSGAVFAAGADLKEFLQLKDTGGLRDYILRGQKLFQQLEDAPIPVVAAVSGKALAGGVELLMHCDYVQLAAESQLGLVEAQVGILPGWGGCKKLLLNTANRFGADQAIAKTFDTIAHARVSGSGLEALHWGLLGDNTGISMNPDRLLADGIQAAYELLGLDDGKDRKNKARKDNKDGKNSKGENKCQDNPPIVPLVTPLKAITPDDLYDKGAPAPEGYQQVLETALLELLNLAAEDHWYDAFGDFECRTNLQLVKNSASQQRMMHLLEFGVPLRN